MVPGVTMLHLEQAALPGVGVTPRSSVQSLQTPPTPNLPGGQAMHWKDGPTKLLYATPLSPEFCPVHLPLGQVTQPLLSVLGTELGLPYLPLEHCLHVFSPTSLAVWYCPLGHLLQRVQPECATSPGAQT